MSGREFSYKYTDEFTFKRVQVPWAQYDESLTIHQLRARAIEAHGPTVVEVQSRPIDPSI